MLLVVIGYRQKGGVSKTRVGEILGLEASFYPRRSLESGAWSTATRPGRLIFGVRRNRLCLRLGCGLTPTSRRSKSLRSGSTRRDPFFEKTSKLAARRLKREIERRGTLGEFALEADPSHLERIPKEESGSDLFRRNEPDAVGGADEVESTQSVVHGCPAQGGAVGSGEKEL